MVRKILSDVFISFDHPNHLDNTMTLMCWSERHVVMIIDNLVLLLLRGTLSKFYQKWKKKYTENSQCIMKNDVENQGHYMKSCWRISDWNGKWEGNYLVRTLHVLVHGITHSLKVVILSIVRFVSARPTS